MYPNAKAAELELFYHQAARMGLDPLARQIHLVTRKKNRKVGDNWVADYQSTIQVGIDGYRAIADRTQLCAGNDDPLFDEGLTQHQMLTQGRKQPLTATVTVYKVVGGVRCPFTATASWDAYAPKPSNTEGEGGADFMWKKMGMLMLAKCAEALALRKAFPAELSGVYTDEEMHQAGREVTVTLDQAVQAPAAVAAPAALPAPVAAAAPQARPAAQPMAQAPKPAQAAPQAAQAPKQAAPAAEAQPADENALDDLRLALADAVDAAEAERLHNRFANAYKSNPATVAGAWDAYQLTLKRFPKGA